MAFVPPRPKRLAKPELRARHDVADHGVFRVERLEYPALVRDVFVFACPDWCNVVAETENGDVVFVWQYRFGSDELSLELPGGVIEPGEDPAAAALRELREETGYVATEIELLSTSFANPALQNNRCYTFLAKNARLAAATAFDGLEDLELALVPARDVAALVDSRAVTHALILTGLYAYLRRPNVTRSARESETDSSVGS